MDAQQPPWGLTETVPIGNTLLRVHAREVCSGPCALHAPSDHHMVSWPMIWRSDRRIIERRCEHGVGHPDPDDWKIRTIEGEGVHGCDGCCRRPELKARATLEGVLTLARDWKDFIEDFNQGVMPMSMQMLKVQSEAGEAAQAWIEANGCDPRAQEREDRATGYKDVASELADVIMSSLIAIEGMGLDAETVLRERSGILRDRLLRLVSKQAAEDQQSPESRFS